MQSSIAQTPRAIKHQPIAIRRKLREKGKMRSFITPPPILPIQLYTVLEVDSQAKKELHQLQ